MSVLIKNGRRYGGAGTMTYTELSDKPSINNVTLSGNKTTSDLGLFSGDYDDLTDKPTLGTAAAKDTVSSIDTSSDIPTSNAVKTALDGKVNGEGLTLSVNNGILRVTYDDGTPAV